MDLQEKIGHPLIEPKKKLRVVPMPGTKTTAGKPETMLSVPCLFTSEDAAGSLHVPVHEDLQATPLLIMRSGDSHREGGAAANQCPAG